jgi:DNA mismatch repair protein PMS2
MFEDMDSLTTYGFRGEAISSLCALGDLVITTATTEQVPLATKLEFDHHGNILSQKPASAKVTPMREHK